MKEVAAKQSVNDVAIITIKDTVDDVWGMMSYTAVGMVRSAHCSRSFHTLHSGTVSVTEAWVSPSMRNGVIMVDLWRGRAYGRNRNCDVGRDHGDRFAKTHISIKIQGSSVIFFSVLPAASCVGLCVTCWYFVSL